MPPNSLKTLLTTWSEQELESAPATDLRRTPQCPSLPEIVAFVDGAGGEAIRQHVAACPWCSKAVLIARKLAESERGQQFPLDSAPPAPWSEQLRARLLASLQAHSEEDQATAPARFDEAGNLHVRCSGLPEEGPVRVSLLWAGATIHLAEGLVRNGQLELSVPVPDLGLRSVVVPVSALAISALAAEDKQP